ncbi:hypothetical protein HJC23_012751 [Cyclotella cryptica]|uniref:HSF-type DNA-binding domain-containing protein n=1 Tax=Cyclotella cryptica TaxID=29204 RepID=A0ABD3Q423_9STRA|eukprot:CCRYP_008955-RA/>CCRYP_008955-RA protein AED:0.03 eAED:0.03 QI:291/1/1/1/0.5/0.33/3/2412/700
MSHGKIEPISSCCLSSRARLLRLATSIMFPNNEYVTSQASDGDSQLVVGSARGPVNVASSNENVQSCSGDDANIQWANRHQSNTLDGFSTHFTTSTMKAPLEPNNNVTFWAQQQQVDSQIPAISDDDFALKNIAVNNQAVAFNRPFPLQYYRVNAEVNALIQDQSQGIGPTFRGYLGNMTTDDNGIAPVAATPNPPSGKASDSSQNSHFYAQGKRITEGSNVRTSSRSDMTGSDDASRLMKMPIASDCGHYHHEATFRDNVACLSQEHNRPHYMNDAFHNSYAFGTAANDYHAGLSTTTVPFSTNFINQSKVLQDMMSASIQNQTTNNPCDLDNVMFLDGTTNTQSETSVDNGAQGLRIMAFPGTSPMIARNVVNPFVIRRSEPETSQHVHSSMYACDGVRGVIASNVPQKSDHLCTTFPTLPNTEWSHLRLPTNSQTHSKQNFALKLMQILSVPECQSAIQWMPAGDAFCVMNAKELVEKVLPKYFKETKYTSFTRKLNRWGFKNCSPLSSSKGQLEAIYCHELFLRDRPELCEYMKAGQGRKRDPPPALATHQLDSGSFQGLGQSQMLRQFDLHTSLQSGEVASKELNQTSAIQPYLQTNVSDRELPKRNSETNEVLPHFFQSQFFSGMVANEEISDFRQEPDSTFGVVASIDQSRQSGSIQSYKELLSTNIQTGQYCPSDKESSQNHSWSQEKREKN